MVKKEKIFLLGVGAQKAGTTWISNLINKHKAASCGMQKEYHIWDAKYLDDYKRFKVQHPNSINQNLNGFLRYHMQNTSDFYAGYFQALANQGDFKVVSDITPSYCELSSDHFKKIKVDLEKYGFQVKVLFSLRDPVERIWSAVRMFKLKNKLDPQKSDNELVIENLGNPLLSNRTRYDATIINLMEVFSKDDVYICSFEKLFTSDAIADLSDFIGIDLDQNYGTVTSNSTPKSEDEHIAEETVLKVKTLYSETYDFVKSNHPDIYKLWI